jgi:hypothetical protein
MTLTAQQSTKVLTDKKRERYRLAHAAGVVCAQSEPMSEERGPHAREGNCDEICDLSVNLEV